MRIKRLKDGDKHTANKITYLFIYLSLHHVPKSGVDVHQHLRRKRKKRKGKEKESNFPFMPFGPAPHRQAKFSA